MYFEIKMKQDSKYTSRLSLSEHRDSLGGNYSRIMGIHLEPESIEVTDWEGDMIDELVTVTPSSI